MNVKKIERYLNMAKNVSEQSDFYRYNLGAVAIYKGGIIATGFNSNKTSPVQRKYNKCRGWDVDASGAKNSLHAEVACLNKIKYLDVDFNKIKLCIYRKHKNGNRAMARPCPACQKMIKEMGIKEVYFTTENGIGYEYFEGDEK